MKFLLVAINAKYIHTSLAVYSLKSYADKYAPGSDIEVVEYTINQLEDDILRDIFVRDAQIICFSCYIWNSAITFSIISKLKKIKKDCHIWVGGPEVSYNGQKLLLDHNEIFGIMYGEGEEVFKNLVISYREHFRANNFLANINGLIFRQAGEIIITPPEPVIDMSTIPFVYHNMSDFENKIIYYESSRGCPFSCSYCLSSIDKHIRFRDINLVKKELLFFIENKTPQVKFVDRTFNCNPSRALDIWAFIKEHDNGITNFHFEIAADIMTEDEINLINTMRPGLIQLEIGVQSTNEHTLSAINRKTDIEKIRINTAKIHKPGNIHQHLDLIAGLPYEDYNSFAKSFNEVYAMKPDQLQLGFLKVLHGAAIEKYADNFNMIYDDKPVYEVLQTEWLSFSELLKLKNVEAVVELYYNSFQFENTIDALVMEFQTAFDMYQELGDFYELRRKGSIKFSRVERYNLLFDFITENKCCKGNYTELLTLDYYLRENSSKRPAFCASDKMDKNQAKEFYSSNTARKYLTTYSDFDSKQLQRMTHLERIGDCVYLFDYQNRNPLNNQAKLFDVTEHFI